MDVIRRDNTSFPSHVTSVLSKSLEYFRTATDDPTGPGQFAPALKYYQYLVLSYLSSGEISWGADSKGARGLLIYHTMGMGKTRLGITMAMLFWDKLTPILIVSKSVQDTFLDEVDKLVEILYKDSEGSPGMQPSVAPKPQPSVASEEKSRRAAELKSRLRFVTSDAYNSVDQLLRATEQIDSVGSLDNTLLIVDEAHNFFRAIVNSSDEGSNARRLYNMVMVSTNIKLLFLTGTPILKDPFEMVPCFNMLTGKNILPVNYHQFSSFFVDEKENSLKNREKLANRLFGLVSYMPIPATNPREDGGFPEDMGTKIVSVEMSEFQYKRYLQARAKELSEKKGVGRGAPFVAHERRVAEMSLPGSERKASSYYVHSRMASLYTPPWKYIDTPVEEIPADGFAEENSPKMTKVVEIVGGQKGITMIYSQFVRNGLTAVSRYLQNVGYSGWKEGDTTRAKRFAVISGETPSDVRTKAQNALNAEENKNGDLIKVLLISKTGAEGLNLRNVRLIVILEPYWDKSRELQVKYRGLRLGSHDGLPKAERDLRTVIMMSVPNEKMLRGISAEASEATGDDFSAAEEKGIDEIFFDRAEKKFELISECRELLKTVSIECPVNGRENCRTCVPTNSKLFLESIGQDLKLKDPCRPMTTTEVETEQVSIGEDVYHYRKNPESPVGYSFYSYNDKIGAYVSLPANAPVVSRILKSIT